MKIRSDLVGVVEIPTGAGTSTILRAGDEMPEGITLGEHLLADPANESEEHGEPDAAEEAEPAAQPANTTGPYAKTTRARK